MQTSCSSLTTTKHAFNRCISCRMITAICKDCRFLWPQFYQNWSSLRCNSTGLIWKVLHYLLQRQSDGWLCFHSLLTRLMSWCIQPGQFCFILIAYFRLKKLVFLDYFDVEMGAGEQFTFIRQYAPPRTPPAFYPHSLFCANSSIPIYILAVELNYCKHLCGPARHNRLAGSCIMSVPPTGCFWLHTIVHSRHVWHSELVETQWNEFFFPSSSSSFFLLPCWNIY